jgi:hypothetical protein
MWSTLSDSEHCLGEQALHSQVCRPLASFIDMFKEKLSAIFAGSQARYNLKRIFDSSVEIAPWSTPFETLAEFTIPYFPSRELAEHHISLLFAELLPDLVGSDNKEFMWRELEMTGSMTMNRPLHESLTWTNAPHTGWNLHFAERDFISTEKGLSCHISVFLHRAFGIISKIDDLRLLYAQQPLYVSNTSYTFGIRISSINADDEVGYATFRSLIREADSRVNGLPGLCERLSLVRDNENFGISWALTLSRLHPAKTPYTLDDATNDIRGLLASVDHAISSEARPSSFSKPIVFLSHPSDLSKELVFHLTGGAKILGIGVYHLARKDMNNLNVP